jgi:hypothetical protein
MPVRLDLVADLTLSSRVEHLAAYQRCADDLWTYPEFTIRIEWDRAHPVKSAAHDESNLDDLALVD